MKTTLRGLAQIAGSFFIVCLPLSSGFAQSQKATSVVSPSVFQTGHEMIHRILTPSLHWIDNERLLFLGMKAGRGPRPDVRKLYLWDMSNRSVKLYAEATSVCVVDGIVRYPISKDKEGGRMVVSEGPPGSEKVKEETLPSKEERDREPLVDSTFTCGSHLRSKLVPPSQPYRHIVVLKKGDGYLDIEPGGGPNLLEERRAPRRNLTLYQASGKAIELPLTWDEQFSKFDVAYSNYKQAYVLRPRAPRGTPIGISGPWPKGKPLRAYLLWADGRIETVFIPYSIVENLTSPRPTVVGWVFGGGRRPATVGLYLFDGKLTTKLDSGWAQEISVSPDGCKAAAGIQEEPFESGANPVNVKIFDFCAESRR